MNYQYIVQENAPRRYGLSWNSNDISITLTVRNEALQRLSDLRKSPIIVDFKGKFSFETFAEGDGEVFGFDGALSVARDDNHTLFTAKIPTIKHVLDKPCGWCHGSGKSDFPQGECPNCGGSGKEHEHVWQPAFAISASLNVLLLFIELREIELGSEQLQLMTLRLFTDVGSHGGSLGGEFSIALVQWLALHSGQNVAPMVDAMRVAYEHMWGTDKFTSLHRFRATVDHADGWLNVDCPGDACGLHPSHGIREGEGYEFGCHNVDSPAQQLTLLAGLAALHNCADRVL